MLTEPYFVLFCLNPTLYLCYRCSQWKFCIRCILDAAKACLCVHSKLPSRTNCPQWFAPQKHNPPLPLSACKRLCFYYLLPHASKNLISCRDVNFLSSEFLIFSSQPIVGAGNMGYMGGYCAFYGIIQYKILCWTHWISHIYPDINPVWF